MRLIEHHHFGRRQRHTLVHDCTPMQRVHARHLNGAPVVPKLREWGGNDAVGYAECLESLMDLAN
jgi:hypothetical protein